MDKHSSVKILQKIGLKVTPQRQEVLSCLHAESTFLSADELWHRLKSRLKKIGLPTVYRILDELIEARIVSRIFMSDSKQYFYLCLNDSHHHHFVCETCRQVEEVDFCVLNSLAAEITERNGSKITSHIFQINGVCKKCLLAGQELTRQVDI